MSKWFPMDDDSVVDVDAQTRIVSIYFGYDDDGSIYSELTFDFIKSLVQRIERAEASIPDPLHGVEP